MPSKGKGGDKGGERCGDCGKAVTDADSGVMCEICEIWFHIKCENIGEPMYKAMMQFKALHWYCETCSIGAEKLMNMLAKLEGRVQKLEKERDSTVAEMTAEMNKMEAKINELAEGVEQNLQKMEERLNETEKARAQQATGCTNTEALPKWSEIVSKAVDSKFTEMQDNVAKVNAAVEETKLHLEEQKEKESRQNNIIIYNNEEERTENIDEWKTKEMGFCLELFNSTLEVAVKSEDIVKITRLGNRASGTKRPMLVQFRSKTIKNEVMESLWKLKNADAKHRVLSINHDMTKKEREECKKLVALAKQKQVDEGQGEFIFRVRGPPEKLTIVKLSRSVKTPTVN